MKNFIYFLALLFLLGREEVSAQVVINEVMANVKGSEGGAGAPGDRNEFVEIYNLSGDTVDMDGWFLDDGDARDVLRAWIDTRINDPDVVMNTTLIPPGGYAVILDPEYPDTGDGNFLQPYDFPPNTIVLTVGNTTIGDGLATTDPLSLLDPDTLLVDTYGTPSDTTDSIPFDPGDGISNERIDSGLPDHESNWLPSIDPTGSTPGRVNSVSVGVEENADFRFEISDLRLEQNSPNPFNFTTLIRYEIAGDRGQGSGAGERLPVRLAVFDITGRLVKTLVDEVQKPGIYQLPISNLQLPSTGIYFYRLQISQPPLPDRQAGFAKGGKGDFIATRKLILLR